MTDSYVSTDGKGNFFKKAAVEQPDGSYADLVQVIGFDIPEHDTIELSYMDGNLTGVVYKLAGDTVGTRTLSYTDGNLVSVIKS
jgi:hypothetical protein